MKATIKIEKEVDIVQLNVTAFPRYWEDSYVNGEEDTDGLLIPCRDGDAWKPIIDVETGQISGWPSGVTGEIHYKVCDQCGWDLVDSDGEIVVSVRDEYVPDTLSPAEDGFGDYIIMNIDENGFIQNWKFKVDEFLTTGGDQ